MRQPSGERGPVVARLLVALALALALALVGCGRSGGDDVSDNADRLLDRLPAEQPAGTGLDGAGGGRDTVDACGLLTDVEVGAATGGTVEERSAGTSTTGDPLCTWDLVQGKDEAPLTKVIVIVYEKGQITFDADKGDPSSEPVSGLGQDAFWHGTVSVLNVLAGQRNVTVQVTDPDGRLGRPPKDVAVNLARAALGRVPGAPATTAP